MTPYLPLLFFAVALVYAMGGFAGGSTYIALLVLAGLPLTDIPQIALICNLVVAASGCWIFFRSNYLSLPHLLPFLLGSIPMAYVGGRLPVSPNMFMMTLGLSLALAGLRLLWIPAPREIRGLTPSRQWLVGVPVGAILGIISGIAGIGGGIFLSPILYFMRWGNARQIAAASSFFIFLNSLSGLLGQTIKGGWQIELPLLLPLIIAVIIGGQIGSRMACHRLPLIRIQQCAAGLIMMVAAKLIWGVVA